MTAAPPPATYAPTDRTRPTRNLAHGTARPVTGEQEKRTALDALVEAVVRGRSEQSRPPNRKELAATTVLALPLEEVSLKTRTGPPNEDEADLALDHWAGVLPLRTVAGAPQPAAGVTVGVPPEVAGWPARP